MKKKVLIVTAFTLMNTALSWSQNIGLLTNTPDAPVHIASSGQLNIPGGLLLLGNRFEGHLEMDFDIIQAMYDQSPLSLRLQPSGGYVGIHTMSPSAPLHIASSGQVNTPGGLLLMGDRNEGYMEMDFDIIQSRYGAGGQTLSLRLQPAGGKTGINTYSPQAPLHVWSNGTSLTSGGLLLLGNTSEKSLQMDYDRIQSKTEFGFGTLHLQPVAGNLNIGNGNLFFDDFNERIGINTNQPQFTLDINGSVGIQNYIEHRGDPDTYMYMGTNSISFRAGDKQFIGMYGTGQGSIEIGDPFGPVPSPEFISHIPMTINGPDLQNFGQSIEGGGLHIQNGTETLFLDDNEIQTSWLNVDNPRTFFINRRGGNIILGRDNYDKIGIKLPNDIPEADLHIYHTGGYNIPILRLESHLHHWDFTIDNSGKVLFHYNDQLRASIDQATGEWTALSDVRFKKNILDLSSVLHQVNRLHPVSYHMVDQHETDPLVFGFIAQEVREIFPELIEEHDGVLTMKYNQFAPLAIRSIQELTTLNHHLETKVNDLQEAVNILTEKLEKFEAAMAHIHR